MAEKENGSESSSALPKLLLELVSEVDEKEGRYTNDDTKDESTPSQEITNSEPASGNY